MLLTFAAYQNISRLRADLQTWKRRAAFLGGFALGLVSGQAFLWWFLL